MKSDMRNGLIFGGAFGIMAVVKNLYASGLHPLSTEAGIGLLIQSLSSIGFGLTFGWGIVRLLRWQRGGR